jgi:glycosyltransferase involved in cell wall biosynthesis
MKTAIVHDWLVTYGGAERVLQLMLEECPGADLFSLFDFIPPQERNFIMNKPVTTSFLQKFPLAKVKYRSYLPLMPLAIEQFDLSNYDLVITSSYAVAKGVITGPDQLHICMCYSPIRYAWDMMHQYLHESRLTGGPKGWLARYFLHRIRMWDYRTSNGVDDFIAISKYIARRIEKVYRRPSTVIYPPVDVDAFKLHVTKEEFYLTASRMVPYKKIDLIVEAFSSMPDKNLVVIGDGPDFDKVKKKAGRNITLLGYQPFEVLKDHMQRTRAFIFAAEEDFGIVPVEAQACGTPVIAYGKGGALETVIENETGLFFYEQSLKGVVDAVRRFETIRDGFDPHTIRRNALHFSKERFHREFNSFVDKAISKHFETAHQCRDSSDSHREGFLPARRKTCSLLTSPDSSKAETHPPWSDHECIFSK